MRRKTGYDVGGDGSTFNRDEWDKLNAAFAHFGEAYDPPTAEYVVSRHGIHERQGFYLCRRDHKSLVKAELESLFWFFHGVMKAHGITPVYDEARARRRYGNGVKIVEAE